MVNVKNTVVISTVVLLYFGKTVTKVVKNETICDALQTLMVRGEGGGSGSVCGGALM